MKMEVDHCENISADYVSMSGVFSEVASFCRPYVEKLYHSETNVILEGLKQIKNLVIGNNKQKSNFIIVGVIRRLVYLIEQENNDAALKVHCAVILGSLAKGIDTDITNLIDCGILNVMYGGLRQPDLKLYEACIRCLRTIVTHSEKQELYCDPSIFPVLLDSINRSKCIQECTCEIISQCCKTNQHLQILHKLNAVVQLANLLTSNVTRVKVKALKAVSVICYKNKDVCSSLLNARVNDTPVADILYSMLSRAKPIEIQLNAAKCLTYVFRSGALGLERNIVFKKVLPCLIRLCDPSRSTDERVTGAKTVAYLIEFDPELQRVALICEQFPLKLAAYFAHPAPGDTNNPADMRKFNYELAHSDHMHQAVFLAYAALLSNDEDMRNLVVNETLVQHVVTGLDNAKESVRIAALQCLLSLSRSVQIIRTKFEDLEVWKAVMKVLQREAGEEFPSIKEQIVGCAVLCNLLLEFCPCRSKLIDSNVLQMLQGWCHNNDCIDLKRNGIWGFMNVTFKANLELKSKVMELLDPDTIFTLLTTPDTSVVIKTLGVLNNVLASSEHVDAIMAAHGDTIMQACAVAFESTSSHTSSEDQPVSILVHMHTLCVIGCIAAGDETKTVQKFLQDNENFFAKLNDCVESTDKGLQRAAVDCLWKLCRGTATTVQERRSLLKEMEVIDKLQRITVTSDIWLSEKIKETLSKLQS